MDINFLNTGVVIIHVYWSHMCCRQSQSCTMHSDRLSTESINRGIVLVISQKENTQKIAILDLMLMKHYAPNRCLYIKVAKLRIGVGSAETSYLQNCSVKLFKEHFKVQICKGRLFERNKITFFSNFHQLISSSSSIS